MEETDDKSAEAIQKLRIVTGTLQEIINTTLGELEAWQVNESNEVIEKLHTALGDAKFGPSLMALMNFTQTFLLKALEDLEARNAPH